MRLPNCPTLDLMKIKVFLLGPKITHQMSELVWHETCGMRVYFHPENVKPDNTAQNTHTVKRKKVLCFVIFFFLYIKGSKGSQLCKPQQSQINYVKNINIFGN